MRFDVKSSVSLMPSTLLKVSSLSKGSICTSALILIKAPGESLFLSSSFSSGEAHILQVMLSVKSVITTEIINLPVFVSLSSSLRILPLTMRLLCSSVMSFNKTDAPSKFLP